MRRTSVLGAAAVAALAAASLAVTGVLGSSHREAPQILADPTATTPTSTPSRRRTRRTPDHRRQLDPVRGSGGRPELRQVRPAARYYVNIDNTGDGARTSATAGSSSRFRNPNSFLDAAPPVDSVDDPDINFVQTYDLYKETYARASTARDAQLANDLPVAPTNVGPEDVPGLRRGRSRRDPHAAGRRQVVRRPARRPVLRRPRRHLRRHQHRQPGRPNTASATRAAARTTSPATTCTRSSCRCPSPR